jgi:ribosomal protein L30E
MLDSERQLGLIVDLLLPLDFATRYDVYFTEKRIAIVCMGKADRFEHGTFESRSLMFGITPAVPLNIEEERKNKQIMEEEISKLNLDGKLKLIKKSCFYSYEEIEAIKLVSAKKPKFIILSKECITKFSPNEEQFTQLANLLPTIEMLKKKLSIFGHLDLNSVQEVKSVTFSCKFCSCENDFDAIFCQNCGNQIQKVIPNNPNYTEITCSACGAKNKAEALFCKKCGKPTVNNQKIM